MASSPSASASSVPALSNVAGSPSTLQELQSMLLCAHTLHSHLAGQVQQSIGLDAADVKARYGHFPRKTDEGISTKRRNKFKHPEPMAAPLTSMEKRKMRLLLHSLRSDVVGSANALTEHSDPQQQQQQQKQLSLADLRGLSRSSVALFERFVLRSADVADSDAESEADFSDTATTASDGSTSATSSPANSPRRAGGEEGAAAADDDETQSVGVQTVESSVQAAKLAQRIMNGDSIESFGGLKTRRFPHRVPKAPVARGAYQGPKSSPSSALLSSPVVAIEPVAGQTYTAIAFRPQSLKQLQQSSSSGGNTSQQQQQPDGDENSASGWTPTFFPVEIVFSPGLSAAAAASASSGNADDGGVAGGGSAAGSATIAGSSATHATDTEGAARLVIRRLPITRDGQRFATSRADAAQTVIADVGCGALRSVVVGQTTRFFLRGRMVLQKRPEWAKKWEWRVPPSLGVYQQQQQQTASAAAQQQQQQQPQQQQRIPAVVDFSTLPSMAQMADRCLALAFVDATVLNLPAKSPDVEEDAALQAAAAKASSMMAAGNNNNNNSNSGDNSNDGPRPLHVASAPSNFLASAGAELALAFPSHAEFNTFLAEAMHWCGDFASFRYGRPADFHSAELLRALPTPVREQWMSLDDEEITFCEEFHVPPSVYLTARRRVTASADPTKSMTSDNALLCEEDLATICDIDYLQLSALIRFLQARGLVKLHSLFYVRKPM